MSQQFTTRVLGAPNTLDYRVYLQNKEGTPVSFFHDIPLHAAAEGSNVFNMVVEIPRWSNAKLEISRDDDLNPIKQDSKKGKARFVRNCFPHKGYIWNYGALPQTWEDPTHVDHDTGAKGDNDPLDVCEIGESVGFTGQIKQVKVLGVMALLDEGETDWKILAIDVKDPLAESLNDIEDIEKHMPGFIDATRDWFRIYKIPDGKPENKFAFDGAAKNKAYALQVVKDTHAAWGRLVSGKTPSEVKVANLTVANSIGHIDAQNPIAANVAADSRKPAAPIDPSVDKWFYVNNV